MSKSHEIELLEATVISFLQATVHQALEKLPKALPPSEEEAKKKGWRQF